MNLEEFIKPTELAQILSQHAAAAGVPLAVLDASGVVFAETEGYQATTGETRRPIVVNGQHGGCLVHATTSDDLTAAQLRLVHARMTEYANLHFNLRDLTRTTARLWKETNFFYDVMKVIAASQCADDICNQILPRLGKVMGVGRGCIRLARGGKLYLAAVLSGEQHPGSAEAPRHCVAGDWVMTTGKALMADRAEQLPLELRRHVAVTGDTDIPLPLVCVPLQAGERSFGTISLTEKRGRRPFTSDDLKLLNSIASQVALAIHNVDMIARVRDAEQFERDLKLASQIQQSLLPGEAPRIPGLDIAGTCISANSVGGDYFGFFPSSDALRLIIADVAGHGIPSALFMAGVRSALRGLFGEQTHISQAMAKLNNLVCEDAGASGIFVTFFCAEYSPEQRTLSFVNGGHTPPLVLRGASKGVDFLDAEGVPAGFVRDAFYAEGSRQMQPGDVVVMYTDGCVEARDGNGRMFGEDGLIRCVRENGDATAREMVDAIQDQVAEFTKDAAMMDDMTILVMRVI